MPTPLPTPATIASRARISGGRSQTPKAAKTDRPPIGEDGWEQWVAVQSSNVAQIRYSPVESALQVMFHSGAIYQYNAVPLSTFNAFLSAKSKGRFVWRALRGNFKHYRVRA